MSGVRAVVTLRVNGYLRTLALADRPDTADVPDVREALQYVAGALGELLDEEGRLEAFVESFGTWPGDALA